MIPSHILLEWLENQKILNEITYNKSQNKRNGRKEIKSVLTQHNRCHFSKAKNTLVYRDKTTKVLHKDEVRDKIVDGTLKRENVDNSDLIEVLNFLMSKKQNHKCTKEFNGTTEVDRRKVVKQ